jgi:hypothetical protein
VILVLGRLHSVSLVFPVLGDVKGVVGETVNHGSFHVKAFGVDILRVAQAVVFSCGLSLLFRRDQFSASISVLVDATATSSVGLFQDSVVSLLLFGSDSLINGVGAFGTFVLHEETGLWSDLADLLASIILW